MVSQCLKLKVHVVLHAPLIVEQMLDYAIFVVNAPEGGQVLGRPIQPYSSAPPIVASLLPRLAEVKQDI